LKLLINEREYLMSASIIILLVNEEDKQSLGAAVLPLSQAFGTEPSVFKVPAEHRGKECGYVAGTVQITNSVSVKMDGHLWRKLEEN